MLKVLTLITVFFYFSCSEIVKAGANMKAVFWLAIMVSTQISRSRFKQSKISLLIPHICVLGCFVNGLVIFWYIWGINSFSQWISTIFKQKSTFPPFK